MISRGAQLLSLRLARHSPRVTRAPRLTVPRTASVSKWNHVRPYASSSGADAAIEEIQELYSNAKDEFEIAAEETEKKTVYAADDRAAAQEELAKLKDAYKRHIEQSSPEVGEEVQRRVGQRIRELDNAMTALEESAMED